MVIRIQLFGSLRDGVGRTDVEVDLPEGSKVMDAIAALKLKDRVDLWVLHNGERATKDSLLSNGDRLSFFQPVGGG
jgi:MoaE-MoaD fusion protein